MKKPGRTVAGILAAASLLSLFWLLPSGAQEAAPVAPAKAAPAAPPSQNAASAPSDEAPEPEAEDEKAAPGSTPEERVSADNNLSFPVDI